MGADWKLFSWEPRKSKLAYIQLALLHCLLVTEHKLTTNNHIFTSSPPSPPPKKPPNNAHPWLQSLAQHFSESSLGFYLHEKLPTEYSEFGWIKERLSTLLREPILQPFALVAPARGAVEMAGWAPEWNENTGGDFCQPRHCAWVGTAGMAGERRWDQVR